MCCFLIINTILSSHGLIPHQYGPKTFIDLLNRTDLNVYWRSSVPRISCELDIELRSVKSMGGVTSSCDDSCTQLPLLHCSKRKTLTDRMEWLLRAGKQHEASADQLLYLSPSIDVSMKRSFLCILVDRSSPDYGFCASYPLPIHRFTWVDTFMDRIGSMNQWIHLWLGSINQWIHTNHVYISLKNWIVSTQISSFEELARCSENRRQKGKSHQISSKTVLLRNWWCTRQVIITTENKRSINVSKL